MLTQPVSIPNLAQQKVKTIRINDTYNSHMNNNKHTKESTNLNAYADDHPTNKSFNPVKANVENDTLNILQRMISGLFMNR